MSCSRGHDWESFKNGGQKCICSACDRNLLVGITMRKQRCFVEECGALLEVDEKVVKERMRDSTIFER